MGQQMSLRKNRRKLHKLFSSQRFVNVNGTLSHTFAILDYEPYRELININTSDENELLRVSEINLKLAKNIIKHRKIIGYYQKVEDLVVVPGMGAERFGRIRHQVCVSSKNSMRNSYSLDSLKSAESKTSKSKKSINVNRANIFELQGVRGITQEVAAAIVCYRVKRGPFKKLEDLRKIKCIDHIRFDNISRHLMVEDLSVSEPTYLEKISSIENSSINGVSLRQSNTNGIANKIPDAVISDIFELLSAYSPRPFVKEIFQYSRNGRASYRVASWNLDGFSQEKVNNLGAREVICRTILENSWSVLAIQDVSSEVCLKLICDELNCPKLPRVREWKNNCRSWKYTTKNAANVAFIYDATGGSGVRISSSESGPAKLNEFCECLVSSFEIGNTKVQIFNLKMKTNLNLPGVQDYLEMLLNSKTNYLLCCDYCDSSDFQCDIINANFIIPKDESSRHFVSNFIINETQRQQFTGFYGVVRHGLSHLAIPSGWNWGGAVSSRYPIWSEFFDHSELNL